MLVRSSSAGRIYVHVGRYPKGQMRFYTRAARLQTVSTPIAAAIRAEAPHLTPLVCSIPYPLPEGIAASGAISSREKEILYVGRIHPEKGIELLLDAFARLPAAQREGWKLLIVGPAEARFGGGGEAFMTGLQKRAAPLGEAVQWIGPVFEPAQLAAYYRRASLFVYPSLAERGETFGLAPLEGMAQGCPPLVSELACFRDFIAAGENGFTFDHRAADPAATLAAQLSTLLADPARLAAAGQRARVRAADYELEKIASRYLEDFHSLLPAS
jgi:glycosyltransferase involved in cell wall biosynthesis